MSNRFYFFVIIPILFLGSASHSLEAAGYKIAYYGYTGIVDLSDIEFPADDVIKDETLRIISAHITRRYHEQGYRAFYIERAVVKPEGVVEFYFNESPVSEVIISGISESESDSLSDLLHKTGEPYNEDLLKRNIASIKESRGYSNIHVNLKRDDNGGIVISGKIVKRRNMVNISIRGDAVYGSIPHVSWNRFYSRGSLLFGFYSSFARNYAEISGAAIFCDIILKERLGLLAGFNSQWGSNYYDEERIFSERNFLPEIALYSSKGPSGQAVFLKGGYYRIYDYPEPENFQVCSGFAGLRFFYNDAGYRIDRRDARKASLDISAGRNSLENGADIKVESDMFIPFPLFRRADLVFKNSFFFTSENERLFHRYVFDNQLPGRQEDYLASDFKNTTGLEIQLEIYPSLISMGPLFYYGVYRVDRRRYESSRSAGLFLSITPGKLFLNFSYAYDTSFKMRDGVFLFAMTGNF